MVIAFKELTVCGPHGLECRLQHSIYKDHHEDGKH